MLRLFLPGPKSRTTAALLAVFLGWAGIHKFYLGYRNVGGIHIALTGVGLLALLAPSFASASNLVAINIVAWVVILAGYYYVRRVHFGHTTAEIINLGTLLLWPWRLIQYTLLVSKWGNQIREREQRGRGRRHQQQQQLQSRCRRNDDGFLSLGCIVIISGGVLSLAVAAAILFLYYLIFTFIGIIAFLASIAIGVAEGILYFRKTDSAFQNEYVVSRRLWF